MTALDDLGALAHCAGHERSAYQHLPGDYSLAPTLAAAVFSPSRQMDARPTEPGMSMQLKLHDTLSREKRPFEPLDPARVRMYVCGPTVYDFAHIGNARPAIIFDVLFRLLRQAYREASVVYTRNVTDVDDKIIARAQRDFPALSLNEAIARVTEGTLR